MAKNLGRKFATMDEEERRRFEMQSEGATDSAPEELDLDNPRNRDTLGTTEANAAGEEPADSDDRPRP